MTKRVFVSHVAEEAEVATRLKVAISRDFLGLVDVFVSSDGDSIAAGEDWLRSIEQALQDSVLLVILCSPGSITRPWVNFEAGAAWMRGIPLVPLCHAGLTPGDLPMPLSLRQGVSLEEPEGLRRLYSRIADVLSCQVPPRSFADVVHEVSPPNPITKEPTPASLTRDRVIRHRLKDSLQHNRFKWRTIERVAAEAAIPEEAAADLLRADPDVRFTRGKSGNIIVGLTSRVGLGQATPTDAETDQAQ